MLSVECEVPTHNDNGLLRVECEVPTHNDNGLLRVECEVAYPQRQWTICEYANVDEEM